MSEPREMFICETIKLDEAQAILERAAEAS